MQNFAIVHHGDAIRHRHGFFLIVRHIDERNAHLLLHGLQFVLHGLPQFQIKCAQRFIQQQDRRFFDQCASQRHPLLLSTGKLTGLTVRQVRQAHQFECFQRACFGLGFIDTFHTQTELHILQHGHVREQGIILEHGVHGAVKGRHMLHRLPTNENLPLRGIFKSCDHPQRSRLAAAAGAKQREKFPIVNFEGYIIHSACDAVTVRTLKFLDDVDEFNLDCGHVQLSFARLC